MAFNEPVLLKRIPNDPETRKLVWYDDYVATGGYKALRKALDMTPDAIIKTNEASNQWAYYQAKSIKGQMAEIHGDLLGRLPESTQKDGQAANADMLRAEAKRYDSEKAGIKANAEKLQQDAARQSSVNDRCDQGSLLLQVALVICSVAILAGSRKFWWVGMAIGSAGVVVGLSAFMI